jgi:exonuclease III
MMIRGIKGKIDEFMISLRNQAPSLICLTEHHLMYHEVDALHIKKYNLGATFCRRKLKNGGVCIYIHEDLKFTAINLHKYCNEQDLEIATIQIKIKEVKIIIFSI